MAASDHGDLDERLQTWRAEQCRVASHVVIKKDSLAEGSFVDTKARFKSVSCFDASSESSMLYGGVDVSFPAKNQDPAVAVYVVMDWSTQQVVYHDYEYFELTVPYVSSYLSFREIDPLERLVTKQGQTCPQFTPCIILVDGNGILHARRAGIACFLGVYTSIPTIGVAKSLYCEDGLSKTKVHDGLNASLAAALEAANEQGNASNVAILKEEELPVLLIDQQSIESTTILDTTVVKTHEVDRRAIVQKLSSRFHCKGLAVRLRGDSDSILVAALVGHGGSASCCGGTTNPIFISIGHKVSLEQALVICASLSLTRIPEPIRKADLSGRDLLRKKERTFTK